MSKPVSPRDQRILARYAAGLKIKDIAAEIGMAANSVGVILRRHGIERPAKPQKRWHGRDDQTAAIIALWRQGLCASQIAERVQCGRQAVDLVLTAAKVRNPDNPRHRYDGIGGIGRGRGRADRSALGRIARRA